MCVTQISRIPQIFFIVRRRNALSSLAPGRLLRYERAHRRRGKGGWLLVRIVRTSRPNGPDCVSERLGRGASLWVAPLKMIRKLNQKIKVSDYLLPSSRDRPQTPCISAFRAREMLLKHLPCTSRQGEVYGRRWLNTSRVLSPLYIGIPGLSREEGRSFFICIFR